jgi:hypothetical protein
VIDCAEMLNKIRHIGAWYPSLYQTSRCPPQPSLRDTGAIKVIGRTMFETDRIPHGWTARLNNMVRYTTTNR